MTARNPVDWSQLANASSNFLPHGYCLLWQPGLLWTLVGADAVIAASYFSIPLSLGYFLRKQPQIRFQGIFAMFMAFILACGITHLVEIANIWQPMYALSAGVKAFTALVSVGTAIALWHLVPTISDFIDMHRGMAQDLETRNGELRDALSLAREREVAAQENERRFRLTQREAPIGVATVSPEGRFLSVNEALADMLGYSEDELLHMTFQQITHPEDLDIDLAHVQSLLDGRRDRYRMEKRYFDRDGQIIFIQLDVSLLRDEADQPLHFISMIQDISQKKRDETALRRSRAKFKRLLENMPTAVVMYDDSARLQYANAAAYRLLGLNRNSKDDKSLRLTDGNGVPLAADSYPVPRLLSRNTPIHDETVGIKRSDSLAWAQVNAFTIPSDIDGGSQIIVSYTDITERKTQADILQNQAMSDALTGLFNRRHCMQTLQQELDRQARYGTALSLIMLDVDHFKRVNDQYGHDAGDRVLATLGDLCRQVLRRQDIACRIGGEEFALILPDCNADMAHDAAERLRRAVESTRLPQDNDQTLHWTISLGVGSANPGDTIRSILQRADRAMYRAKRSGRNCVIVDDGQGSTTAEQQTSI